jgi:hypothetical protein
MSKSLAEIVFRHSNDKYEHKKGRFNNGRTGTVVIPPSQDPDNLDRTRCWFENFNGNEYLDWTRYMGLGLGNKCGLYLPPHEGDEITAFSHFGDPHNLFYIGHNSERRPPPDEHTVRKPEEHWLLRTFEGHIQEWFDDPLDRHIRLKTTINHEILMDDVEGQRKVKLTEYEGRYINLDSEQDWIDAKTLTGNRLRLRDAQQDILIEHPSGSFAWFKANGDLHINAAETLWLTAKRIVIDPSEDLTWHIPPTTHECKVDGIDYVECKPVTRVSKCWNCEEGSETDTDAPSTDNSSNQVEFTQDTPSSEWTINHNKNKYPQITIMDDNGFVVDASIQHVSKNQAKIYFNDPAIGKAICD